MGSFLLLIGLELLADATISQLWIVEKDPLIFSFWFCVFFRTTELCNRILGTKVDIELWKSMQHFRDVSNPSSEQILDLGFAGLIYNRTNFSGILNANPIGGLQQNSKYPIDCRYNPQKLAEMIRHIAMNRERVHVVYADAVSFIQSKRNAFIRENAFLYIDPPYFEKGAQLYRYYFDEKQHIALAGAIRNLQHCVWLLSYDNHPAIQQLYPETDGITKHGFYLDYSVRTTHKNNADNELLISNIPIPPIYLNNCAAMI